MKPLPPFPFGRRRGRRGGRGRRRRGRGRRRRGGGRRSRGRRRRGRRRGRGRRSRSRSWGGGREGGHIIIEFFQEKKKVSFGGSVTARTIDFGFKSFESFSFHNFHTEGLKKIDQ